MKATHKKTKMIFFTRKRKVKVEDYGEENERGKEKKINETNFGQSEYKNTTWTENWSIKKHNF